MKYLALIPLACFALGCKHSEFDVTPDQVAKHNASPKPGKGGFMGMKHLPPGAEVHTMKFKKGDQLPDGTLATGDVELKKVVVHGKGGDGQKQIISEDITSKQ